MSERDDLLTSIAETIKDYRVGELAQPTPEHVDQWIRQFGREVQVPLLRELDHVFKRTYFSKADLRRFFAGLVRHRPLVGDDPCAFWRAAHLLRIQQNGKSQEELLPLLGEALREQCGLKLEDCGTAGETFIYLDDALFSGDRIRTDLSAWIASQAPARARIHILVKTVHKSGAWWCRNRLTKAAGQAGKNLEFHCWPETCFENRMTHRDESEVLWPAAVPDDAALRAYRAEEKKFPFEPRQSGGRLRNAIFSSEEGRRFLERELLLAGVRIRCSCQNPSPVLRPLGYSSFGLGFGSMVVTYRNCPNNAPLALWWGDPDARPGHPFRTWYPLLKRKPNAHEMDL